MDSARFDDLLRLFASGFSRRDTLGAALSGLFATGSLALVAGDTEAKKKKGKGKKKKKCKGGTKKCGKKCIPSTNCCTTADCDGNEVCQNGACTSNCTPQCDGKECGDDGCGDSCGSCDGDESCEDGTCTPVVTCTDGVKNGSEIDVDCGGSCPRCANGKTCATRDDCASAVCEVTSHTCMPCFFASHCTGGASGPCFCRPTAQGEACVQQHRVGPLGDCSACPAGSICTFGPGGLPSECHELCRAA